jgi:hypothetical protein
MVIRTVPWDEMNENYSNGGRAEQSTKVIGFGFVDAHVRLSWSNVSLRVDVPSQQKKRLIAFLLWLNGQQSRIYSSLVDVPSNQRR